MNSVDVSVIIPYYNDFDKVGKLLESIPDLDNIQTIVVDDCSPNNTQEFLDYQKNCGRKNTHFIRSEVNVGAGACRNIALKEAKGKWLLFADADDWFTAGAFNEIEAHLDSEADILFFPPTSWDLTFNKVGVRHMGFASNCEKYLKEANRENELELRLGSMVPWSKMVRKSMVDENKIIFDETWVSNDVMFSTKTAIAAKEIQVVDFVIYCASESANRLTTKRDANRFKQRVEVAINRNAYLREHLKKEDSEAYLQTPWGFVAVAMKDGYGLGMAIWVLREYSKNGEKVLRSLFNMGNFSKLVTLLKPGNRGN